VCVTHSCVCVRARASLPLSPSLSLSLSLSVCTRGLQEMEIHGEFLRLLFFLSNKHADDYFAALGYEAHKEEFCNRRGVFFHRNRCTTAGSKASMADVGRIVPSHDMGFQKSSRALAWRTVL